MYMCHVPYNLDKSYEVYKQEDADQEKCRHMKQLWWVFNHTFSITNCSGMVEGKFDYMSNWYLFLIVLKKLLFIKVHL